MGEARKRRVHSAEFEAKVGIEAVHGFKTLNEIGNSTACIRWWHVQRLMRRMALTGITPGPTPFRPHPEHRVYPYLLRGMTVVRPDQAVSTDITYIRLAHGFVYLTAVIDWYSRHVLAWRISNSMDTIFCVDFLRDALDQYGKPEIFNTDQCSQFTDQATPEQLWIRELDRRLPFGKVLVAIANKHARQIWAMLAHEVDYDPCASVHHPRQRQRRAA